MWSRIPRGGDKGGPVKHGTKGTAEFFWRARRDLNAGPLAPEAIIRVFSLFAISLAILFELLLLLPLHVILVDTVLLTGASYFGGAVSRTLAGFKGEPSGRQKKSKVSDPDKTAPCHQE